MAERAADRVLVDSDVVSYLFRGDTRAERYRPHLDGRRLGVSFMTIAELDRWARERNWGERRRMQLDTYLLRFSVYLVDRALCQAWADVTVAARRAGRPIQTADAWIAATALAHSLPLVTHNGADYAGVAGLTLLTEPDPGGTSTKTT
jgi:predicted nucleic acid-binding protein